MIDPNHKKLIIISKEARVHRFNNDIHLDVANIYDSLEKTIGCTYLLYMYENLITNEKYVYSSNWGWQDNLIGQRLINHCPIFLSAFKFLELEKRSFIFLPWYLSPPTTRAEKNTCGIRSEFNIANGFGYGSKKNGIRETLAFGGEVKDVCFYKHFIEKPSIFFETLQKMRFAILMKNHQNKLISNIIKTKQ